MENLKKLCFMRAIEKEVESGIISPKESDSKKGYINWGDENSYPEYLNELYHNVSTLQSIIEGTVDFVCGDGIEINDVILSNRINSDGDTIEDLVRNISRDYLKFGGFAINIIRNKVGQIAGLYYIPFERLRSDEHNNVFYYSKEWVGRYKHIKAVSYPKFDPNETNVPSSIYYYSNDHSNTYPTPKWGAAVKACEIEMNVNDFHLSSIKNGFAASYMISMNNGVPDEQQADEIEDDIKEKFCSSINGGSVVISFADDKEHSAELTKLETDDAGEKYKSLIERTRQEIFTSFRAQPQLFGMNLNTAFSTQEYDDAFKLYNKTAVSPIQKIITRAINYITGKELTIKPFKITEE